MEQKALIFGEDCINKNRFHIFEKSVNIDKIDIKRIALSKKETDGNNGLYIYMIVNQ